MFSHYRSSAHTFTLLDEYTSAVPFSNQYRPESAAANAERAFSLGKKHPLARSNRYANARILHVLLYKSLMEKRLQWPRSESGLKLLTRHELGWLMEGLSIVQEKAFRHGHPGTVV